MGPIDRLSQKADSTLYFRSHASRDQCKIMNAVVFEIRKLPKDQQLNEALAMLEHLLCNDASKLGYYQTRWKLRPPLASVLHYIAKRSPQIVTHEQIWTILAGRPPTSDEKFQEQARVRIFHIRRALHTSGIEIESVPGHGWRMSPGNAQRCLPSIKQSTFLRLSQGHYDKAGFPPKYKKKWSFSERTTLLRLVQKGQSWRLIADRFGRSETACKHQYHSIKAGTVPLVPKFQCGKIKVLSLCEIDSPTRA